MALDFLEIILTEIGMRKAAFGSTDLKCLKINFSYHYKLLLYTSK